MKSIFILALLFVFPLLSSAEGASDTKEETDIDKPRTKREFLCEKGDIEKSLTLRNLPTYCFLTVSWGNKRAVLLGPPNHCEKDLLAQIVGYQNRGFICSFQGESEITTPEDLFN